MLRLVRAVSCRLLRSMKIVPARVTRNPSTGQRRTSALDTKRTGTTELTTHMSSQDTWLLTMRVGASPAGSEPRTVSRSRTMCRIPRAQRLMAAKRRGQE